MSEIACICCGTKKYMNEIKYTTDKCKHYFCVDCIYRKIMLTQINSIKMKDKFEIECECGSLEKGKLEISLDDMEKFFDLKYTVNSEDYEEKEKCEAHKNEILTKFCKTCNKYICDLCCTEKPKNENEKGEVLCLHKNHNFANIDEYASKYKEYLNDLQIQHKTAKEFVEKFDEQIENFEKKMGEIIYNTVKQIDDQIESLIKIKSEYTSSIEKILNDVNKYFKILKLFYSNFYIEYEGHAKTENIFVLQFLRDMKYEFEKIEFTNEINIYDCTEKINESIKIMEEKSQNILNYDFLFKKISKKYSLIDKLTGHSFKINTIIQTRDGKLVTGSSDYKIKFWEEQEGRFINTNTIEEYVGDTICLCELQDTRLISTEKEKSSISVWNSTNHNGKEKYSIMLTLSGHKSDVNSVIQLPDETLITGSKDGTARIWNSKDISFICVQIITLGQPIYCIGELSGQKFMLGGESKKVVIYEEETGKNTYKVNCILKECESRISAVVETIDNKIIAASGKFFYVYKSYKDDYIICQKKKAHHEYITSLLRLSSGKIVSTSRDKTIRIWDFNKSGDIIQIEKFPEGHSKSVYAIIELQNGTLASVGGDNVIILWKSGTMIED